MRSKLEILLFLMLIPFQFFGQQSLAYAYDNSGNRVGRSIVFNTQIQNINNMHDSTYFEEELGKVQLRIYPNPVKHTLKVSVLGFSPKMTAECVMFNLSGIIIDQRVIEDQETQLDVSNYLVGTYILQIVINGEKTTWKIIKE